MDTLSSPHLTARGSDYWVCDDLNALLAWLRSRADLHEWPRAAQDRKSYKEITRFYHKWPHYRGRIEEAGIVLDRGSGTSVWLRLVGSDLPRVRRIVEQLASSNEAAEETQLCLF